MAKSTGDPQLSKKAYERQVRKIRERLAQLQVKLKDAPFTVLLILAGPEGAGRGDLINTLGGWLDPRGVENFAFHDQTDEERERPLLWRFWRSLPAIGRIGIYTGSWYTETLREEARDKKTLAQLAHEAERIRHFENRLSDNGTLIVKVWLKISHEAQRRRLHALQADPLTAWRVNDDDWHHHRQYDRLAATARFILTRTDRPGAPWTTIDAEDERARDLAVAQLLLARFAPHARRHAKRPPAPPLKPAKSLRPYGVRRLHALPLDQKLSAADYEAKREKWLGRLNLAVRAALQAKRSIVFVFEGWDAAGKGGAIRRLTSAIDPRFYRVIPVAKPTDEERQFHYLWRFWRQLPRDGRVTIFDRSWYGRVLVERIEGFCRENEWRRAFGEIADFESQLAEHGTIVVKYWLHISREEQLRRFRERESTTYKQHKINAEDWRNRAKWQAYEIAVGDMLALTDHAATPWHLVPANNKRFARLEVLRAACRQIESTLAE